MIGHFSNFCTPPLIKKGQDLYFNLYESFKEKNKIGQILNDAKQKSTKSQLIFSHALELFELDQKEKTGDNKLSISESEKRKMKILSGLK